METFDLLIIFTDGTEKIISGVSKYQFNGETMLFSFFKNEYQSFLPKEHVKFFGRKCDYMGDEKK